MKAQQIITKSPQPSRYYAEQTLILNGIEYRPAGFGNSRREAVAALIKRLAEDYEGATNYGKITVYEYVEA